MPFGWVKLNLAWLLAVFALVSSAAAGEDDYIAMSVNAQSRMTVPLIVNGQETLSVIDTAATFALVDDSLVSLEGDDNPPQEILIHGLSDVNTYQVVQLDHIEIGRETLRAMPAGVVSSTDFPSHKTVIPVNAFDQRVIDFDFKRGSISLYDHRPRKAHGAISSRLKYQEIQGLIFIPIKINGKTGLALVDTGADISFINGNFARLAKVKEREDLTRTLVGIDLDQTPVRVVSLRTVQMGSHLFSDFRVLASDPPLFEALGVGDQPIMVLGLNGLRHFRVQIDRRRKEVWLSRRN